MDNFQLPAPQQGTAPVQNGVNNEEHNMNQSSPIHLGVPQQMTASATMPIAQSPPSGQFNVVSGIPISADDIDLIEKQWVSKAKEIVEKTSNDPYLQTKEMNKFKAEYIKKRYNKDVKVME